MVNEKTGEIVNSHELRAFIDKNTVEAYKRNFGYYQLVTSELTMDDKEVIEKYHGLSQIENQFRIMVGGFITSQLANSGFSMNFQKNQTIFKFSSRNL